MENTRAICICVPSLIIINSKQTGSLPFWLINLQIIVYMDEKHIDKPKLLAYTLLKTFNNYMHAYRRNNKSCVVMYEY